MSVSKTYVDDAVAKLKRKSCCCKPKVVTELPVTGNDGKFVIFEGGLYYYYDGEWMEVGAAKEKIEIPNTAFADVSNPNLQEVRTWVNANLTEYQKINSELVMVENTQSIEYVPGSFSTFINASIGGTTNIPILNTVTILGITTDINEPLELTPSTKLTDFTAIETKLTNALTSAGYTGFTLTASYGGPGSNFFRVRIDGDATTAPITWTYDYTNDILGHVILSSTYNPAIASITLGSTVEEPDYVWDIINDDLTELHRRTNNGGVWYIDTDLPYFRRPFAQKGNPDKPFQSVTDFETYATVVAGDTVVLVNNGLKYTTVNDDYTVKITDHTIDNTVAVKTTTLLSAVGIAGQIFYISNSSGGIVTVDTTGAETIYFIGGAILTLDLADGEFLTVQSTGSSWRAV